MPKFRLVKSKQSRSEPEFDILHNENFVDEKIYHVLRQMAQAAEKIEDKITRERWLDALQTFRRTGSIEMLLRETEWRRKVVPMEQFIYDPFYLGIERGSLYPVVEQALIEIDEGDFNEVILMGALGIGKALSLDTPIPTPNGFVPMGKLRTGGKVFDEAGNICNIVKAHDVLLGRKCYRVEFSDGQSLIADEDHLWYTEVKNPHGTRIGGVRTTREIAGSLKYGNELRHRIPVAEPIKYAEQDLLIDPYVMGAWLGDGSSADAKFFCSDNDNEVIGHIAATGTHIRRTDFRSVVISGRCPTYRITATHDNLNFVDALRYYGVVGNKHVPCNYLQASVEQRTALLQGLMDTDGTISLQTGVCEFVTKYPKLRDTVMQLLWSLGLKPTTADKIVNGAVYYRITFTAYRDRIEVFRLARKRERCRYSGAQSVRQRSRYITNVVPVKSVPVRCITVDSPNRLYLAGHAMIPTHNTTVADIGICRDVYRLSCMRNPQTSFGIQGKAQIVITVQSVRFRTAQIAIFSELGGLINGSPYFKRVFPYDKKITSNMIFPEHKIRIMPATSSTTSVISLNVIGGFLDEANFLQKIVKSKSQFADEQGEFDQAKAIYSTLADRRKTRFNRRGKLPGRLYLASSSRYPTDFTQERAKVSSMYGGTDKRVYVYNYAQWEAKPRSSFLAEEFRVQVGNENYRSKVLEKNEVGAHGCQIITVPMDFHNEFLTDPDKSIRDFAGLTLFTTNPFISRRETIVNAFELARKYNYQSPYNLPQIDLSGGVPIPDVSRIRRDVPGYRIAHVDLGLRKDAAGIAIGHIAGFKVGSDEDAKEGVSRMAILPVIAIDAVMRVVPPRNGEIDFSDIRRFLMVFKEKTGLDLRYVTTDGFQSVDTRQILKKQGFITDYLSVEKIEASRTMRDALYDGRLLVPEHLHLAKELRELEVTYHNNKEKVDHPSNGSKDLADAVCGVVQFLMTRRSTWTNVSIGKGAGYHFLGDTEVMAKREVGQAKEEYGDVQALSRKIRSAPTRKQLNRKTVARK